jgi:hypothetical protein
VTKLKYHQAEDGEWMRMPLRGAFKDACCDCGLVHTLHFRIIDGTLEMKAFRNVRATAAMRRKRAK